MSHGHVEVCIVGAGPRGLSVLERLCANERKSPSRQSVTVHVIDPARPGAGRVWRADQSGHLLMNTVASQVTLYTDASVAIEGPVEEGPGLYDWARSLAAGAPLENGPSAAADAAALAEARRLGPDSYPTRAFYGRYLEEVFRRVVAGAPEHVRVRVHRCRAVALDDAGGAGGPQTVVLEDGTVLDGLDAVVLAQGHVPAVLSPAERELARYAAVGGLFYQPPANPADVDLSGIAPGTPVLLRGLGLNFFDHMALLTAGRGGVFERVDGRLVYRPSGREPRLYAGSRRGVPYHARGENEKGPHGRYTPRLLTTGFVAGLRRRGPAHFLLDLWPLVAKEVESVYYGTLLRSWGRTGEAAQLVEQYLVAPGPEAELLLLDEFGIPAADRWDWDRIARPWRGERFTGQDGFRTWLLEYLAQDLRHAEAGNVSGPLKAALDVLRDLRNEIRLAVDHRGLDGGSHREDLDGWYTPLNAFLSIGPPASRIEELIALVEAGVLEVLGPGMQVTADATGFTATSRLVPGHSVTAPALIEARLPEPDLRRTADPLLRHLLTTGQCRAYRIPAAGGEEYATGGLEVTGRPYRVVDADGRAHPRRFAYGVPTESVHWVTAAGIRPGVDSVTLGDSDAIARTVLALPPARALVHDPGLSAVSA
jgi:uncharacterized NAD(P)/FAD-binding protein YdhS